MKLICYTVAQFLISEWIWSFTAGFCQMFVNVLMLILFLWWFAHQRMISAVLYATSSQLFAFVMFTICIHALLDGLCGVSYDYESVVVMNPCIVSLALGMVYTLFQALFFYICSYTCSFPLRTYIYTAFFSNLISSLLVMK